MDENSLETGLAKLNELSSISTISSCRKFSPTRTATGWLRV
jgi:hypothetical protein